MRLAFIISLSLVVFSCTEKEVKKEQSKNLPPEIENIEFIPSQGTLECNELIFNAGEIKKGESINHTFSFTNTGNEPVILLEKTMSCNCTNLKTSNDTVQPNKSIHLDIEIDTKDKKTGKNDATITVKTNGKRKFYLLEVDFEVVE